MSNYTWTSGQTTFETSVKVVKLHSKREAKIRVYFFISVSSFNNFKKQNYDYDYNNSSMWDDRSGGPHVEKAVILKPRLGTLR